MVFIFESHPVQYKAPVYQQLQKRRPDCFRVIYATDCSVRGYQDREFGERVVWDKPLLSGYQNRVLNNERGVPLTGFRSLTGRGIYQMFKAERPKAVLFSQFLYEADAVGYLSCLWLGIPIWIRHETQDEVFSRPFWKKLLRGIVYRLVYRGVSHAFYLGQLTREHLLRHGIPAERMSRSPYCTVSSSENVADEHKQLERAQVRAQWGVTPDEKLVLFSGKFIEKKNPGLILQALHCMTADEASKLKVVFVGAGELEKELRRLAEPFANRVHFAGFVNQSKITGYYLAADILVLPSRRAGETWGLVVNEALQAGCAVVMTDTVGCHREFGTWERVRVIPDSDAAACARAIQALSTFPRSFDWCAVDMEHYSVQEAAESILRQIERVEQIPVESPELQ